MISASCLLTDVDRGHLAPEVARLRGVSPSAVSQALRSRRKEANPRPKTDRTKPAKPRPAPLPDQHAPQQKPGRKKRTLGERNAAKVAELIAQGVTDAKELADQSGLSLSTVYHAEPFQTLKRSRAQAAREQMLARHAERRAATARHQLPPVRTSQERIARIYTRCPGCGARAHLLPHGYCYACQVEALAPDGPLVRPDPRAPAGYLEPGDRPSSHDPESTPEPLAIRARAAELRSASQPKPFQPEPESEQDPWQNEP